MQANFVGLELYVDSIFTDDGWSEELSHSNKWFWSINDSKKVIDLRHFNLKRLGFEYEGMGVFSLDQFKLDAGSNLTIQENLASMKGEVLTSIFEKLI